MAYKLIGKNFTPPDIEAKVTGKAKYAEDFRMEGMVFCRLLTSPMPHAKVKNVDTSRAEKIPGFVAILRASEVPQFPPPNDPILTDEPQFVGDPILAVAATDETAAADIIDAIRIDYEPLPFTVDPLESLFPRGPDARTTGNVANIQLSLQTIKWDAKDFAVAGDDKMPMGKPAEEWSFGDIEAGFKASDVVVEQSFVTGGYAHQSMEPRSAAAYWENGKAIVMGSSQSQQFMIPGLARYVGVPPQNLVYIAEFCGGGFGSKGAPYPVMAVPAHMAKKTGRPTLMRISRQEEYYVGNGRPAFQGYVKMGFRKDGRLLAADIYVVQDNGPNTGFFDFRNAGQALSLVYQPEAMRWRGVSVLTNTPPKGPQRGPGENQTATALEPIIDEAARKLGLDRVQIRKVNAPNNDGKFGEKQGPITSAYLGEALQKGAEKFNWAEKAKESGKKNGTKVTGLGVGTAYHTAGANGFDGLVRITTDGKLHIHSGCGNLGTYSYASTSRAAAEALQANWDDVIIERGDTRKGLPFVLGQFGSNTTFTQTRTMWVAGQDAKTKLQEIAAKDLGGNPDDYDVGDGKVWNKADKSKSMTWAKAAQRAVELGGKYDGHELPEDINPLVTKPAAAGLAGTGLMGVAKDKLQMLGTVPALAAAFVKVEVDTETGQVEVKELLNVADCGTVMHPQGLQAQVRSASVWGVGMARFERYVYDPKLGLPANTNLYQQKPPSYLDVPSELQADWVDMPDRSNPVGAKGIGEPIMGSVSAAIVCAIQDALGGHMFNRTPIVPDMILNAVNGKPQSYKALATNSQ